MGSLSLPSSHASSIQFCAGGGAQIWRGGAERGILEPSFPGDGVVQPGAACQETGRPRRQVSDAQRVSSGAWGASCKIYNL
jgi:hypothetical protein